MNMEEVFRVVDEAFAKERAEQESLIIKEIRGEE